MDNILLQLAGRFEHMDRTQANNIGRMIGIDQDTMNLLLLGRKELELTLRRQKESTAVTKQQAEEDAKLQKTIVGLKQEFAAFYWLAVCTSNKHRRRWQKLLALLKSFGSWVQEHGEFIRDFLQVLAVGLGAIALATLPINLTLLAVLALAAGIALLWQDYQVWKRGGNSFIDWSLWQTGINAAIKGITALKNVIVETWEALKKFKDSPWVNGILNLISPQGKPGNFSEICPGETSLRKTWPRNTLDPKEVKAISLSLRDGRLATSRRNCRCQSNRREFETIPTQPEITEPRSGLAQWHPDRQSPHSRDSLAMIFRQSNAGIEQLAFVQFELNSSFKKAGDALRGATNESDAFPPSFLEGI